MQSDLISRSKLRKSIQREEVVLVGDKTYIRLNAVMAKIDVAPGVDAVEVVRCRDCRYFSGSKDKPGEVTVVGYCDHINHHILPMTPERYCADGRRKDGGASG